MAGHYEKQVLILGMDNFRSSMMWSETNLHVGAMGCGAYYCPPRQVAEEMKAILFDEEFVGWFKEVAFAVYPVGRTGKINYDVFKEVIEAQDS